MEKMQIKSGQEIIEEFLTLIGTNPHIDEETLAAIRGLWQEKKLNQTRLRVELEQIRRMRLRDGQAQEG